MIKASDIVEKFRYALEVKGGYIWGKSGQTWTRKLQDQLVARLVSLFGDKWKTSSAAKNDNYYQGGLHGDKWIGHRVWDCSGLWRWAMKELGKDIAHGSNSIYDRYCKDKGYLDGGKRTDGKPLLPGSPVFTSNPETGKKPHIGCYEGDGNVIEAASTIKGVVRSRITDKNSKGKDKWTHWGEMSGVDYEEGGEAMTPEIPEIQEKPADPGRKTLRKGDKGDAVRELQQLLIDRGYDLGKWGADGDFGNATEKAVKAFQKAAGLTQDGICGKKTWAAIEAAEKPEKRYTVTVPDLPKEAAEKLCKEFPGATMKEL